MSAGKFDRLYDHERELQWKRDAAQELYEALSELHRACMGTPVGGGDGETYAVGTPTAAVLNKANAALRKARGEQVIA